MVERKRGIKSGDKVTRQIMEIAYDKERQKESRRIMGRAFYNITKEDMEKKFSI